MISLISCSVRIPEAPEQGPSLAPPENVQAPSGLLQLGSVKVKDLP
jgi:hypothetical protein